MWEGDDTFSFFKSSNLKWCVWTSPGSAGQHGIHTSVTPWWNEDGLNTANGISRQAVLKTQSRLRPRSWADSSQSNPNARSWQSFFSRCVRKSMWWKASFPPKHRQLSCCSFYLGWSINLHPDLARATALLRGGLMCSTSPLMEALPRLSHISKTDTLGFPLGAKAHHCGDPFEAEECLFPWQSFAPQSV